MSQQHAADLQEAWVERENHENWYSVSDLGVYRRCRVLSLVCCGWVCNTWIIIGQKKRLAKASNSSQKQLGEAELTKLAKIVAD